MTKVFLDTNIIIDVICKRSDYQAAATILNMGLNGELELYITNLSLSNILYITRKEIGKDRALETMRKFCKFIKIAPCGQDEADMAFSTVNHDFEDALQYYSALAIGAEVIITRNQKHFKYANIPVEDCRSFLANSR